MPCHPPVGFRPTGAAGHPSLRSLRGGMSPHWTIQRGSLGLWPAVPGSVFWIIACPVPEAFSRGGPKPAAREKHPSTVTAGS